MWPVATTVASAALEGVVPLLSNLKDVNPRGLAVTSNERHNADEFRDEGTGPIRKLEQGPSIVGMRYRPGHQVTANNTDQKFESHNLPELEEPRTEIVAKYEDCVLLTQ